MDNLDAILAECARAREERNGELREAFRDPRLLVDLICRDCANLIASIGGYIAPADPVQRQKWIREKMFYDPMFVARVKVIENLVREYVEFVSAPSDACPPA